MNGGSNSMVNDEAGVESHSVVGFFGASIQTEENRCDSRNSNHEMAVMIASGSKAKSKNSNLTNGMGLL